MPEDQERIPVTGDSADQETGSAGERTASLSSDDDSGDAGPTEVEVTAVDEIFATEQTRNAEVTRPVSPSNTLQPVTTTLSIDTGTPPVHETHVDRVATVITPGGRTETISRPAVPCVREIPTAKTASSAVKTVAPLRSLQSPTLEALTTVHFETENKHETVTRQMTSQQHQSGNTNEQQLNDEDPVFTWARQSVFGGGRSAFIIHKVHEDHEEDEDIPSLPFLQILLRDTYTELEGGEPGAKTVEFLAGEPRIPQVQDTIVTLDLTEGGWSRSTDANGPEITRNNTDIVPKLQEVVTTLYSGTLGYFVLNVPAEWEDNFLHENFHTRLATRILGEQHGDQDNLKDSPVTIASPEGISTSDELLQRVASYFGFQKPPDTATHPAQIEGALGRYLRRNDWKRIALTSLQESGEESDEHYLWKASIAEAIAREIYGNYQEKQPDEASDEYEEFLEERVLDGDWFATEESKKGESNPIPDIEIKVEDKLEDKLEDKSGLKKSINTALKNMLGSSVNGSSSVAIEVETGRSEGAFNFRKFRDTVEKFESESNSAPYIAVVVPPRLLFGGKQRARMIKDIVTEPGENAGLYVPSISLGDEYAFESFDLTSAEEFLSEVYSDDDD